MCPTEPGLEIWRTFFGGHSCGSIPLTVTNPTCRDSLNRAVRNQPWRLQRLELTVRKQDLRVPARGTRRTMIWMAMQSDFHSCGPMCPYLSPRSS